MIESCGGDFAFATTYTQSPLVDSALSLSSNCGIHLDWEAGKKITSRDGRLLCQIALFQGRKIGAHFGAHLNQKRYDLVAIANDVRSARKAHW